MAKLTGTGLMLRLPVIGPIVQLNELSRCCRTISMLIKVGLPLPDILTMCIQSSGNKIMTQSLTDVKQEMLAGEGLAGPMGKRSIFLPLMVQMIAVGEKTGNLGNTLTTVADSFETDADDKTTAAVGMITAHHDHWPGCRRRVYRHCHDVCDVWYLRSIQWQMRIHAMFGF